MKYSDKKGNGWEELDAFFDYPRAEPCYEKLDELLAEGSKNKGSVIKLYLENFKSFNETFGYQFGGLFLREIARFLCGIDGADVYRPAGVEFVIVLDKCKPSAAMKLLDEISERFENTWHINGLDCMCTTSLAVAYYPGYSKTAAGMMEQMNYALSVAASRGPNRYCAFDEKTSMSLYRHNSIARLIPSAIEAGLLELRYRPIYHIEERRYVRADSYMRLLSPEFGIISAAEFVPIAEETGQIYLVSQYAVTKACELVSRLIEKGIEFEKIAVPISPVQFLQDRFVDDVRNAIEASGIPADQLAFEVSESVALSGFSSSHSRMDELSEMGIEIILTEFGSGYSGINSILNMPVDVVKLGRMLVWQMDNDPNGPALVEGLVHTAKNLNLTVIAEGVETQTQTDMLTEYGCNYQQGFYFSPTLAVDELIDTLQNAATQP